MSAIKKFFEKKKTDAKFKLAGAGQKLGDSQAAEAVAAQRAAMAQRQAAAASSRSGPSRGDLSNQQKLAASAALNRLSNAHNDQDFEKKRSQAAIRAQAKKELDKEREVKFLIKLRLDE